MRKDHPVKPQRVVPQVKDIKRWIDVVPPRVLPDILVCVLKNVIRKNVFPNRHIAPIVASLESRLRFGVKSKQR